MKTNCKWNSLFFSIFLIIILFSACEDIFEKDISNQEVNLIAPGEGLRTSVASQTFWWENLEGARIYNLQIVSPSFESVELVIADTNLVKNKFEINLFPGKFEWRLKAKNGSYESKYIVRTLEIDSSLDLKGQKVILYSPQDESYLNTPSVLFKWFKLYNADSYSIEIHGDSWSGSLAYSLSSIIYDTASVRNLKDGVYLWGIKAWNRNSATDFSIRKLTVDRTSPAIPVPLSPADKASFRQLPVNITWSRPPDQGSPLYDSLIIASDSLFSSEKIVLRKLINDTKFENAVSDTGSYFWKVKTIDAAHNQSLFSEKRRFKVLNK